MFSKRLPGSKRGNQDTTWTGHHRFAGCPVSCELKLSLTGRLKYIFNFSTSAALSYGSSRVRIAQADASHDGVYECTATNAAGKDIKYIRVQVAGGRGDQRNEFFAFQIIV